MAAPLPAVSKLLFAVAVFILLTPQERSPASVQADSELLGVIKTQDPQADCGCSFQTPASRKSRTDEYVFLSDYSDKAWVNIDGVDVELKRVSSRSLVQRFKHRDTKGDRIIEVYKGKDILVKLLETVTRPCRPNDENCEYVFMNAVITVTKGKRRQVVQTVGGCGC